ncbi:DUF3891 family protein [Piscibacillus salipiscarius]|uniref:DUF3891 family protein n=1 Tax=Piscibacillus salipiscarius TaxID=299480 RepID=UPI0034E27317
MSCRFYKQKSTDSNISRFISREIDRQNHLRNSLELEGLEEQVVDFHFNLLQFCDDLSLYICLNKPNTSKEDEIFMFKDGFRQKFSGLRQQMNAHWINEEIIKVSPFPFKASFKVSIPYVEITQNEIVQFGLASAYGRAKEQVRNVTISD